MNKRELVRVLPDSLYIQEDENPMRMPLTSGVRFFVFCCLLMATWVAGGRSQLLKPQLVYSTADDERILSAGQGWALINAGGDLKLFYLNGREEILRHFDRDFQLFVSSKGKTLAAGVYNAAVDDKYFLEVFSLGGQRRYQKILHLYQDDLLPVVAVAQTGALAILRPETNLLNFFSPLGDTLFHGQAGPTLTVGLEKMGKVRFSENGSYLAVFGAARPATVDQASQKWISGRPFLSLFAANGTRLWTVELDGTLPQNLWISPNAEWTVATTVDLNRGPGRQLTRFYTLSSKGTLLFADEFPADDLQFAPDEAEFIRSSRDRIQRVRTPQWEIMNDWSLSPENGRLWTSEVNWERGEVLSVAGFLRPSADGYEIQQASFRMHNWADGTVRIENIEEPLAYPFQIVYQGTGNEYLLLTPFVLRKIVVVK